MFHEICTQITRSSRKKEIWFCRNCKYWLMDYYMIHSLVEHRKEMTLRCYFYFQILAFMYSLFTFYHQGKFISIKILKKKFLQNVLLALKVTGMLFQCQTWYIYYCVCDLGFDASNELKESSMHLQKILQKVSGSTDIWFILMKTINLRKPAIHVH